MRALFERLRCKNYEEVVVASSIIRPGVAESGMMKEYIERHQKTRLQPDHRSPLSLLPPANGSERMKMLTLEDRTGTYEATLFPRVYAKFAPRTHWRRRSRRICH
jgi:DNA polymerase III alpha subunit